MKKAKLFLENFLVYGLGGVISKVIPFIMVPIVTRLMPSTEYYGISDTLSVLNAFFGTLAVFGMYDAMFRMFFEKDSVEYQKQVCSTSLFFTLLTSLVISIIVFLFKQTLAENVLKNSSYNFLISITSISVFLSSIGTIIAAPTRMQNKRMIFLAVNALTPALTYAVSIYLLLGGQYLLALPVAALLSSLMMVVFFLFLNREWFSTAYFDFALLKSLLFIAVPIAPNILIYWVYNSCDRVMITYFLDIGQEGIYSVGGKLGQISQLIYTAFAGGWQYFAFSTMKDKNQIQTNSKVFEYLGIVAFVSTLFLCSVSFNLFDLLFDSRYISGYILSPYLFFAPLVQMLFQTSATQFTIQRKTYLNTLFLLCGAIVNILLNVVLIHFLGIEGAAIATVMGYAVAVTLCVVSLLHYKLFVISKKFIVAGIFFIGCFIFWRTYASQNFFEGISIFFFACVGYYFLYRKDISLLIMKLERKGTSFL